MAAMEVSSLVCIYGNSHLMVVFNYLLLTILTMYRIVLTIVILSI